MENNGRFTFSVDEKPESKKLPDEKHSGFEKDFAKYLRALDNQLDFLPAYSRKSVKKAGRKLRKRQGDLKKAEESVRVFRFSHQKPLNTVALLIKSVCNELNVEYFASQRLKRLDSIVSKLRRSSLDGSGHNQMNLLRMNDVGGCRFIVPDVTTLNFLRERLPVYVGRFPRIEIEKIIDYVKSPKSEDCGYRSQHLIFLYHHHNRQKYRIEAQLRTQAQHW